MEGRKGKEGRKEGGVRKEGRKEGKKEGQRRKKGGEVVNIWWCGVLMVY